MKTPSSNTFVATIVPPVRDNRGRVVGINKAIFSRTSGRVGIGFAIPINLAVNIADQRISTGVNERGYLGVMMGDLSPELAKALAVEDRGVLVNDVLPGTPAADAGFQPSDSALCRPWRRSALCRHRDILT